MWRYFMAKNTCRYVDVLQELLESYNNGSHKSIKTAPMQVTSEKASQALRLWVIYFLPCILFY